MIIKTVMSFLFRAMSGKKIFINYLNFALEWEKAAQEKKPGVEREDRPRPPREKVYATMIQKSSRIQEDKKI